MIVGAVALASIIATSAVPSSPQTVTTVSTSTSQVCSDYYFIGARGSGEIFDGPDGGMGMELNDTFESFRIQALTQGVTVTGIPVVYPAVPIDKSFGAYITAARLALHLGGPFDDSVAIGTANALQSVREVIATCADSKIVLGGFSQGAAVMVDTLAQLTPVEKKSIAAVVAFGDPQFNGSDSVADQGGYDPRYSGLLGAHAPWSELVDAPVFSYCHPGDHVCGISTPVDLSGLGIDTTLYVRDFAHVIGLAGDEGVGVFEPHSSYVVETLDAAQRLSYALHLTSTRPLSDTSRNWRAHLVTVAHAAGTSVVDAGERTPVGPAGGTSILAGLLARGTLRQEFPTPVDRPRITMPPGDVAPRRRRRLRRMPVRSGRGSHDDPGDGRPDARTSATGSSYTLCA